MENKTRKHYTRDEYTAKLKSIVDRAVDTLTNNSEYTEFIIDVGLEYNLPVDMNDMITLALYKKYFDIAHTINHYQHVWDYEL